MRIHVDVRWCINILRVVIIIVISCWWWPTKTLLFSLPQSIWSHQQRRHPRTGHNRGSSVTSITTIHDWRFVVINITVSCLTVAPQPEMLCSLRWHIMQKLRMRTVRWYVCSFECCDCGGIVLFWWFRWGPLNFCFGLYYVGASGWRPTSHFIKWHGHHRPHLHFTAYMLYAPTTS